MPQKEGENRERNRGINRSTAESRQRNMDGVSARGREFHGIEETRVPEGDTSTAGTGGAGGNTRNDYNTPPRGIRYSRQFMDAEESVRIRLEKVSEKDIGRQCVGLYAALGLDLPASNQACPETMAERAVLKRKISLGAAWQLRGRFVFLFYAYRL